MLLRTRQYIYVFLFFAQFFFVVAGTPLAFAQLSQSDAHLEVTPNSPGPNSGISVSLNAYTMDTVGAQIFWYLNGKELANFKNERSIVLTTGALGTSQSVRAVISKGGISVPVETKISPVVVDVVLESNTHVPVFYRGRALPSGDSRVRAIAVVNDGTSRTPGEYSYEWKYNDTVLFGGSVRGKQTAEFLMPLYQDNRATVSVFDSRGALVGKKTLVLFPQEPELLFYEDNPLRGISRRAVSDKLFLLGEETTVNAEPYFMNTNSPEGRASYEWRLDGVVTNSNGDPRTITLRRSGDSGQSNLGLSVVTEGKIPQLLRGTIGIFF